MKNLINCPEHFIEHNTEPSWLHCLRSMSTLGIWADNTIIQAVANTNKLRIIHHGKWTEFFRVNNCELFILSLKEEIRETFI